jgi:CRP-like cAMP-binding protein
LKLTKLSEQGKEVIIRYAGAGEFVAATAIFEEKNYPLTAEAVVSTEVTGWERRLFSELMARYPGITMNLLAIVLERIDDVQNRYLELCAERVEQRIARSLLRLMRRAGVKTPEGIRVDFPLSRQNIADFSGTTLFTVSRTLSLWEKRGWILSGRERITVVDPHSLVLFSEKG